MKKRVVLVLLSLVLLALGAAPIAADDPPIFDDIVNGSFETGVITPWGHDWDITGEMRLYVTKPGEEPPSVPFTVTPSDGQYALISQLASPTGDIDGSLLTIVRVPQTIGGSSPTLAFDYRVMSRVCPVGVPQKVEPEDYMGIEVIALPFGGADSTARSLSGIAEDPFPLVLQVVYTSTVVAGVDTGNVSAQVDLTPLAGQAALISIMFGSRHAAGNEAWLQLDNIRFAPASSGSSNRTDVSVIVYGGWDGLPVDAWVGGTAQPRMTTAVNGYGEQQAMWSFWPEPGASWQVSTQPALPAGLDPAQWEYRLVRVDCPTMGWSNAAPSSGSAQIMAGHQYIVVYQLVHKG
ncbi:MAG: hypothetical protein ACYC4R_01025 [Anaerolineae bacterium]